MQNAEVNKRHYTGEPDDGKLSSPARRGVDGKVSQRTTRQRPTLLHGDCVRMEVALVSAHRINFLQSSLSVPRSEVAGDLKPARN
jgi:hypothetical protein